MEIIKDINSNKITRILPNGLTEVKEFCDSKIHEHYYIDKNNKKQGDYTLYYHKFGIKHYKTFYKNDLEHGKGVSYDLGGNITSYCTYRKGKKHGICKNKDGKFFYIRDTRIDEYLTYKGLVLSLIFTLLGCLCLFIRWYNVNLGKFLVFLSCVCTITMLIILVIGMIISIVYDK